MNLFAMKSAAPIRRRFTFDPAISRALERLSHETEKDMQELIDEAVRDLLKKYNRPVTLREMLQQSARRVPAND